MMLSSAWLGWQNGQRDWLETGFLALLPTTEQRPDVARAIEQQNQSINRKVIWLAGATQAKQAVAYAEQLQSQLQASGLFSQIVLQLPQQAYQQSYQQLFKYRYQLLDDQTRRLLLDDPQRLAQDNLALLYSPFAQMQAAALEHDPWLLFSRYFNAQHPLKLNLEQGVMVVRDDKDQRFWALVIGELQDQGLKLDKLETLLTINDAAAAAMGGQGGELLATGMPLFTAHGSRTAQQEMSLIGAGSTLGVVLLLLLTFRSPRPLLLSSLAVASGLWVAWVVSLTIFTKLHILTLVFGASLIGVVVDYALHFFCDGIGLPDWTPRQGLRYVMPGIAVGLLTSLLGYAGLGFSPFPGLQEIAVFSALGLMVAWLTVVGLFPFCLEGFKLDYHPRMLKLTRYWQQHWPNGLLQHRLWLSMGLLILIGGGLLQLEAKDDVRLLQSAPAQLLAADGKIRQLLPISRDSQFFLVSGKDQAEWYQNERRLLDQLHSLQQQQVFKRFDAISGEWPDAQRQQENYRLLQTTLYKSEALTRTMNELGFSDAAQRAERDQFIAAEAQSLSLSDWLSSVDDSKRQLWLGCDAQACQSIVTLTGIVDKAPLASLGNQAGIHWVDQAGQLSDLFQRYRLRVTVLLIAVCGLLLAVLMRALGWRDGLRVVAVPLVSMLVALAVLGWLGELFTLFNLFALLLVMEVGVDYAIFFQMAASGDEGEKRNSTALAVTLSALTTLLAYGLLAACSTAIVHAFGITLAVGILSAFLLAPLVGFKGRVVQ